MKKKKNQQTKTTTSEIEVRLHSENTKIVLIIQWKGPQRLEGNKKNLHHLKREVLETWVRVAGEQRE